MYLNSYMYPEDYFTTKEKINNFIKKIKEDIKNETDFYYIEDMKKDIKILQKLAKKFI